MLFEGSQALSEISGQFQTDLHQLFIGMEIYCHTYSIHYCSLFSGVDVNNCSFFFFFQDTAAFLSEEKFFWSTTVNRRQPPTIL